ncbi:UNVERIFIED_CONTAM: hypothetical protein FKN15_037374 [Acipenser sinensis]
MCTSLLPQNQEVFRKEMDWTPAREACRLQYYSLATKRSGTMCLMYYNVLYQYCNCVDMYVTDYALLT